jgi:hypothetical protein
MNGQTDRRTIEKMYIAQDRAGVMKELRWISELFWTYKRLNWQIERYSNRI